MNIIYSVTDREFPGYFSPHLFLKFLILFFISVNISAQQENYTFQHYSVAEGIFEPIVLSVIQDREGYLWFGSWGGVEKFDGYRFTIFRHQANNPGSLIFAKVQILYEDRAGNIWVGTNQGLEKFNKANGIFTHYKFQASGSEWSNNVLSIFEDRLGILWIGTGEGLYTFDKKTDKIICIRDNITNPDRIGGNGINDILEDKAGSLWICSASGLEKLDRKTGKFTFYWNSPENKNDWGRYWVNTIIEDKSGILWLGTRQGIIAFDQKSGIFTPYIDEEGNSISSISEDNSGHLWVGSWNFGLYVFDKSTKKFSHYTHNAEDPGSLSSNRVSSICLEKSGTIWISTFEGVNKLNISEKAFKYYQLIGIKSIKKGRNNRIWVNTDTGLRKIEVRTGQISESPLNSKYSELLYEDKKGNLWFEKKGGGIVRQNESGKITNFYTSNEKEFKDPVDLIYEAPDGIIWVGTNSNGCNFIDPVSERIIKLNIPDFYINCIYVDLYGLTWIGTFNRGLFSYNKNTGRIKSYIYDPHDPNNISGQTIHDICEDNEGNIWFGSNRGLNKYNRSTDTFTHFTDFPSPVTFTILKDNKGNFWCNTREGISKFNPETYSVQNFNASDGLPENGFKDWAGAKSDDGGMYFANADELIGFHPDEIRNNSFVPPVVITNFLIYDKPFPVKNKMELSHSENFLSFEFSALSYISTAKNQYSYMMEGVDKDWVYSGVRHYASYPNLAPGEYIFKVKGSNNDGIWNEAGISVLIIISPPFWKTWWAYLTYTAFFILILYAIRRYEMNRISYKNQVKLDKAVLLEKEETDKIKSRFFANISHEFRTPLTLILGPAEKIISNTSDDVIKEAKIIKRNSRHLLRLINQLLDLSKLEAGKLKLDASKGNIVSFVKGIALSFESLSESKDITLKLIPEKEFIELYFDKEKMMKILTNILSNAFKFTPAEGIITISIKETLNNSAEIKIKDTGIGIASEEIPKLFDMFYQVDSSHTREYEGTGIGLSLTKELIELHHGSIKVESKQGNENNAASWTEFTLEFKTGKAHFNPEEIIIEDKSVSGTPLTDSWEIQNKSGSEGNGNGESQAEDKTIILVVEDNYDMREYIKDSLRNQDYRIEEAVNGEQGVRKAEKIIPDLIITDLMMPKMDGNDLVKRIKNDEKTSHIPIILLTAKAGQENKLEGLETGADDYLTKPFDIKELQIRIVNLIRIRKKLQEKFSRTEIEQTVIKKLSSIDENFMLKVKEIIDKHMSEEEFTVEDFGRELGMSRMQVHRKLKALTGKSAVQYIRNVKLARARKMIEDKKGNISEIAYSLGFGSPAYFTKCFKDEFGYPPSELNS